MNMSFMSILNLLLLTLLIYLSGFSFRRIFLPTPLTSHFAFDFLLGLLTFYFLNLLTLKISSALMVSSVFIFLAQFFILFKQEKSFPAWPLLWRSTLPLIMTVALLSLWILFEPIRTWDARSIWYYHARMMFAEGGLIAFKALAPFPASIVDFAHLDYPKMFSVLAATSARVVGFWNEYLPQWNIVLLLLPPLALLFNFYHEKKYLYLLGTLLLIFLQWEFSLRSGYVDAHLAIYTFWAGYFLLSGDFLFLLLCLTMMTQLKNEGLPLALCFIPAIWWQFRQRVRMIPYALLLLSFCIIILSRMWNFRFGLTSDLSFSFERVFNRLTDVESVLLLFKGMLWQSGLWRVLVLLTLLGVFYRKLFKISIATGSSSGLLLLPAVLYSGILFLVYCSTPYDLAWHLNTSVDRTLMPVMALLILFFISNGADAFHAWKEKSVILKL